jgi:predicted Zn-dependent peptidase
MNTTLHTLPNGLRIALTPLPEAQSVTVMVTTATGSRFESEQENGMAHFLEHMLFKGTTKRPKAKMIAEALDKVGGEFNAFTSKDHTAYYAKVDARHAAVALDVVSDIFLHATLAAKEIEKERGTITEEINMYEDMPMRNVYDVFDGVMFGGNHPLGRSILGPKKNIASFTRTQFKQYLARNYVAHNTVVSVAGAFNERAMLIAVKKAFADMRTGDTPPVESYTHIQDASRVRIKHKATDQTHFMLGVPSVSFGHADEAAVDVLATILGGGMSSRLFTEVREKRGLAYYIKAGADTYVDTGYFFIRAGVTNEKCADAVRVCMQELRKITRTAVPAAELLKAKEFIKGTRALSLDTTDSVVQFTGYSTVVRGRIETLRELDKKTDAVTAADVQRVAKQLFNTQAYNLAVIGPHTNEGELLGILKQ